MRISDWSSDVCSSDLESTAARPFLKPRAYPFRIALSEQLTKREDGPLLRGKASDREDALVDHPPLRDAELDARGGHQMPDQPAEEHHVAWSLLKRPERRKPGRPAAAQRDRRGGVGGEWGPVGGRPGCTRN